MVQSKRIGALLLAVSLAGCGSYSMFDTSSFTSSGFGSSKSSDWKNATDNSSANADPASTASTAPTTPSRNDTESLNSLFARAAQNQTSAPQAAPAPAAIPMAKPVVVADAHDTAVAPPATQSVDVTPRGRAYLFRGIAGLIYSRGMDKLAERIRQTGIPASVDTYLMWRPVADQALRDYRRDPQPIILIGHSMGGDAALAFAEMLNANDIPVNLVVTYDPSRIADDVPPNVERYINIFQSTNVMGGGNVVQGSRFHGHYASYNLKDHNELIHINIEKVDRIQEQLVKKIVELASTPASAEGDAIPIRLEVPSDSSVELWDSGQPMTAHAGDTLRTFADTYHVPLWSLAEINAVSPRTPLTEGQRIVIPRHLVPMAAPSLAAATPVSSYAPVGR
ncbi:MAG: LysM peptidoglycan-binding domain-containing protein [Xanthobacteraceae bacterium]